MSQELPGCSVIIIAYNSGGLLPASLNSMQRALVGMEHQILVLDNGSPEPLGGEFAQQYPDVEFIHSDVNLGFGKACNAAATKARHPYLFFVNPDTLVSQDTFRSTLSFMLSKPEAGIAGCRILNSDGSIQWACRRSFPSPMAAVYKTLGLAALFPKSRRFGAYNLTYLDPEEEAEVDAVSGSFFCVSQSTYRQVGGFDESFFMYGEDLDICFRVKQAGYKNYYYPGTSIIHFKGQSSKTRAFMSYVNFYQAMLVFVRKHHYYQPFPASVVSGGIVLAALLGVFSRLLPRWWKMLLDMGCMAGAWYGLGAEADEAASGGAMALLWLCTWLPLLLLGEYSTSRLDSRHMARVLAPALGGGATVAWLWQLASPQVYGVAAVGLILLLFWRRAYHWGSYFFRVFTGQRGRAVLLGSSTMIDRWFDDERVLPGWELLGSVSCAAHTLEPSRRLHLLGRPSDLWTIRLRTGCRKLLVVSDAWGRHEPIPPPELLNSLKMHASLLIGHPDTSTFMLVDLNYLK